MVVTQIGDKFIGENRVLHLHFVLYCAVRNNDTSVDLHYTHTHTHTVDPCVDEIIMSRGLFLAPSQSSRAGVNNKLLMQTRCLLTTLSTSLALSRGPSCDAALSPTDEIILTTGFPYPLHHSFISCLHITPRPLSPSRLLSTAQPSVSSFVRLFPLCDASVFPPISESLSTDPVVLSSPHQCVMKCLFTAL